MTHSNKKHPDHDKLSFAFISNDVYAHSASPFLYAIVKELVKLGHEVCIYTNKEIDSLSHSVSDNSALSVCSKAVSLKSFSLDESKSIIAKSNHDVIIDAEGHTNDYWNMKVLNDRLAPYQMTWAGYPGTTGNSNIDFFITDKYYCPKTDCYSIEKPLVLDGCSGARYPIEGADAPEPGPSPFIANGYITFGTLNNSYKVTPSAIKTWAKILLECKESRFIFFRNCYASSSIQANLNEEFESHGISKDRISYIDNKKMFKSHLECYQMIDICLDTFPLTGGVTTIDSLWMGVPVITIEGENYHQRITSSALHHIGISELVSTNEEEMVNTAVRVASDEELCMKYRQELRKHLLNSDMFNPQKTAHSLAEKVRNMF